MLKYTARRLGFVDSDETWKKIVSLYESGELSITQLAQRFGFTHAGISYGLKQRGVFKRKNQCGANASPA